MKWAQQPPRVPPAACQASTSRLAKMSHVWPTARPGSSIIHEMDSGSTQIAFSCMPGTDKCENAKMSHVWPTVCLSCSVMHEMGSTTTCRVPPTAYQASTSRLAKMSHAFGPQHVQAAKSCMKWTQEASRVPMFGPQRVQAAQSCMKELRKHPECLQLHAMDQQIPEC
jgi:hypothetical protein